MVYSWNCDRKTVAFCELRGQFRGCCQDVNACYRRRRAFFLSESTFSNCQFCRIQFVDTSPLSFWQLAFVPTLGLSSSYFSNGKLIDEGWNSFWSFLYQMTTRRVKVGLVLDFCTLLFWTKKKTIEIGTVLHISFCNWQDPRSLDDLYFLQKVLLDSQLCHWSNFSLKSKVKLFLSKCFTAKCHRGKSNRSYTQIFRSFFCRGKAKRDYLYFWNICRRRVDVVKAGRCKEKLLLIGPARKTQSFSNVFHL